MIPATNLTASIHYEDLGQDYQALDMVYTMRHEFEHFLSMRYMLDCLQMAITKLMWFKPVQTACRVEISRMTDLEHAKEIETLYRFAFKEYGPRALWNMRPVDEPSSGDVLAITSALRTHGGMNGRRLAERIEELCRASH